MREIFRKITKAFFISCFERHHGEAASANQCQRQQQHTAAAAGRQQHTHTVQSVENKHASFSNIDPLLAAGGAAEPPFSLNMETLSCIVANHHQQGGAATAGGRCHVTQLQDSGGHRVTGSRVKHIMMATANVQDYFLISWLVTVVDGSGDPHRKSHWSYDQTSPSSLHSNVNKGTMEKKRFQPEVSGVSIGVSIGV